LWHNYLYFETPDNYLVSLDAKTGKERWHVELSSFEEQYFSTMAPIVIGNHVLVGTGNDLDMPGFLQSFDPETGKLYVPSRNSLATFRLQAPPPDQKSNLQYVEARGGAPFPTLRQGLPLFKPPYSRMTAIDMNTGEHLWMMPLGDGNLIRNHPMLKDLNLPPLGGDSVAIAINFAGDVIGYSQSVSGGSSPHAFYWSPSTGAVDLGVTDFNSESFPLAINSSGEVIGFQYSNGSGFSAFRWILAKGMKNLENFYLPFTSPYQNQLLGDAFYTAVLFGGYALFHRLRTPSPQTA
jgi:probable HAF family extracellular repeat protein